MSKTKLRAVIIDDEVKSRNIINSMVQKYCPQVEVVGLAESVDTAFELINKVKPNLLLLDIEMPHGNGFDLLNKLPETNFEIIFITGFDHYALKAINFHALDYLLKPVDIEELIGAIKKVEAVVSWDKDSKRIKQFLQNMQNPDLGSQRIAIPTSQGREFIPVEDIVYCEADGSCTWIYYGNNEKIYSSKNLGEYEKLLPRAPEESCPFYRVHYGFLINVQQIKSLNLKENSILMSNEAKVLVAQRRKAGLKEVLKQRGIL